MGCYWVPVYLMVVISFIYSATQIVPDLVLSTGPYVFLLYFCHFLNILSFFFGLRCSGLLPQFQFSNHLLLLRKLVLFSGEWHLETQIWVLGVLTVTGKSLLLGSLSGLSFVYLLTCFIPSLIPSAASHSSVLWENFQALTSPLLFIVGIA